MARFARTLAALVTGAAVSAAPAATRSDLRLFLLGHDIGTERSTIERSGSTSTLVSHFEYHDRGAPVILDATLAYRDDFTPVSFEAHGKSYRYFGVDASVASVPSDGHAFALEGMAPVAAQQLLIRYWLAHGRPAAIDLLPSGDVARVAERAPWTIADLRLRHFTVEGLTWGRETIWLDSADLHLVAAVTTAGALGFEATEERFSHVEPFVTAALRDRLQEQTQAAATVKPRAQVAFALTNARLIDATGAVPVEHATVIVRDGRIAAAGDAASVPVPPGTTTIDVSGKTILPGLWDMHAHAAQIDWGPVYLAEGVTTARDMGGEFDVVTTLRDAWKAGRALGPRLLLAGLVDGPGPDAFGTVTAAAPSEGGAVVHRYKEAGFQQMKIYSLLDRPTTQAVVEAAHAAGMTVTGHIPTGLTLRDVVEMGFDNVAHLVVRETPGTPAFRDTVALLKAHGTVMDPTLSWNELLGRSRQTPIATFQPGIDRVVPPLRRLLEGANGGDVTPEQAHQRLARSLAIVRALHDAGIPIVAGTDKGVPGSSVQREIELYVQAGFTPMDAIRAATAVPARVMGLAADSGIIAPGLRADLIVVDGNPLDNIADLRRVTMVCVAGRLFDTAPLWQLR